VTDDRGTAAMESLYPFLYAETSDLTAVLEEVRASTVAKISEISELRQVIAQRDGARIAECARAAADRPTRPLPRSAACSAIAVARCLGQPGNRRLISSAMRAWNSTSSLARRSRSRSRRRILACSSARHCCSACSKAGSSTSRPCRSYRLRVRLHRTTTADRPLAFFARRVSAASPAGRNTR